MNKIDVTNPAVIQTMYNNFVKITDWIIKGSASQYPMPGALAEATDKLELVGDALDAITTLQDTVRAQKEALDKHAVTINALITEVNRLSAALHGAQQASEEQTQQAQPAPAAQPQPEPVQQHPDQQAQPQPALVGELMDLDTVPASKPKRRRSKATSAESAPAEQPAQPEPAQQTVQQGAPTPAPTPSAPPPAPTPTPNAAGDALQILAARVDAGDLSPAALEQLTAQVAQLLRG